jgi:hypothetical protein
MKSEPERETKESLGDDLLLGAPAIAKYLFGSSDRAKIRKVYNNRKRLPLFNFGGELAARKSTLLAYIEKQEKAGAA